MGKSGPSSRLGGPCERMGPTFVGHVDVDVLDSPIGPLGLLGLISRFSQFTLFKAYIDLCNIVVQGISAPT